jgi:AmmeMemoRadiSam system protein B
MWYPQEREELEREMDNFLSQKSDRKIDNIHGLIVPHAGYEFSGKIAGKAFSLLKNQRTNKVNRAVVLGPSHYIPMSGVLTSDKKEWETSLGDVKVIKTDFRAAKIEQEHSIDNQIPFLQKLGIREILPLMVGEITNEQAIEIIEKLSKIPALYVFSTDLSLFLPYEKAVKKDRETIKLIEDLDLQNFHNIDACGFYPILVMMHLCKLKGWKPKLIEYKNSGDVTREKENVVGYASFFF